MKCPTFQQLIDYADGRLPTDESPRLATHLAAGCHDCVETVGWYDLVRRTAASDDLVAPPQWVLNRAIRIFDRKVDRPNLARRISEGVATLVFDSLARPAMVGVRSTETADRQLLFDIGEFSLDLRISQSAHSGSDLIGQILREGDPKFDSVSGLKVQMARGDEVVVESVTDEIGEFKARGVEFGKYDLRIELSEGCICVPEVPVGEYRAE